MNAQAPSAQATCLPSPLHAQARARGAHEALRAGHTAWSYARWAQASDERAATLQRHGVRPGMRVALFGTASPAMAASLFALHALGAVPVLLAPQLPAAQRPARALACGACAIVGDGFLDGQNEVDKPLWWLSAPPDRLSAAPPYTTAADWPLHAPVVVFCTSGSTGTPKPVALSGLQLLSSAFCVASRLGHLPSDVWLACLPWHHVGGAMIVYRTVLLGARMRVQAPFCATACAQLLDAGEISLASFVPTMLERVLDARPARPVPARLRAIVVGGAAMPARLAERARHLALPLAPSWGMTEAASQVATRFAFGEGPVQDAGPPMPHARVYSEGGLLAIDGLLTAGWRATKDRGALGPAHQVLVHGRADDVMISGGENIAPEPIEAVLLAHPKVADAAVGAAPSERWGQRPVAYLVLAKGFDDGQRPSPAELLAFCRARLASSELPVRFEWTHALPRDPLGKLRRKALGQKPKDS